MYYWSFTSLAHFWLPQFLYWLRLFVCSGCQPSNDLDACENQTFSARVCRRIESGLQSIFAGLGLERKLGVIVGDNVGIEV